MVLISCHYYDKNKIKEIVENKQISIIEVQNFMSLVCQFVQQNFSDSNWIFMNEKLNDALKQHLVQNIKQTKITSFFKKSSFLLIVKKNSN